MLTHTHTWPGYLCARNPGSVFSETTTISEICGFPFISDSVITRFVFDKFDGKWNNVGVVSGLPDQCEIIHGLMRDPTRGTCD